MANIVTDQNSSKTILGVDPGLDGALVLLENYTPIQWASMPSFERSSATGKRKRELDPHALAMIVDGMVAHRGPVVAAVEAVHSMPKQGVASSFGFGQSTGIVIGVLAANGLTIRRVRPERWKASYLGLIGGKKDAALTLAISMLSSPAFRRALESEGGNKEQRIGLADAFLIAHFATGKIGAAAIRQELGL